MASDVGTKGKKNRVLHEQLIEAFDEEDSVVSESDWEDELLRLEQPEEADDLFA